MITNVYNNLRLKKIRILETYKIKNQEQVIQPPRQEECQVPLKIHKTQNSRMLGITLSMSNCGP